jgi:MFS family permease
MRPRPTPAIIAAITLGNGLEFFDFVVYSFFATIIGKLFFPSEDKVTQLMLAVGTYGIAFIARPVGGIVLGLMADRLGRKPAMNLTLALMALGSLAVGCAPTAAQAGLLGPVWLLFARLVQGFSLGGEVGASTALLLEYADDETRGYYSSWQSFSQALSSLSASFLAVCLTHTLSQRALESWGWRIPFFVGVLLLPVGIWIRRHVDETLGERRSSASATLTEVFSTHLRTVVSGIVLLTGGTAATYLVVFYAPNYAATFLGLPLRSTLWSSVASSVAMGVAAPLAGLACDRYGRKPVLAYSRGIQALTIVPCFFWLEQLKSSEVLMAVVAFQAVLTAFSAVAAIVMITEMCPRPVRATACSVIYGLGVAAFGGSAQVVATWLITHTGSHLAPAWYMIGCDLFSVLPLLWLAETAGKPA